MIQFFRNIIFSKIGAGVTIAFLVLIALAFASGDILNVGGSSSIQSSDEVAQAGPHKVTAAEFEKAMTNALESEKENNPQLTMKAFIAAGGTELVLRQLLDRNAIVAFGDKHGIVAGDRLIDSEIAKIPGAQGADGRFNQKNYEQFIQERRLTDKSIRSDLAANLVARQVLLSAGYGAAFPQEATLRYAALLREHRKGAIAYLPSESFAPKTPPSDAEIAAFYDKTRSNYLLPERRVIRYATFDAAVVKTVVAPTEAEIAARYAANRAQYTASETRKIVQLILPTEAAARTVLAESAKGVSLEQAAKSKGLVVAASSVAQPVLASQTSPAVAEAAYAARTGIVVGPAKSGLGWHLLRVDGIDSKPARTLDEARAELTTAIAEAKRRQALSDFSAKIEEQFDSGSALSDVTKQLGVAPTLTAPLTADGKTFGNPGAPALPADLARVVQVAFSMDRENQPQLAEIEPGKKFVVFDVTAITAAAPAPLAQIKAGVMSELMLQKGEVAAKAAADRVLAATKRGTDLAVAVAQLGMQLPSVDPIDMGRDQLNLKGRQVPPPLALLFSMAQGTVKLYPAPRNRGWYLVAVKQIIPGNVVATDPMLVSARKELAQLTGREYADQMRRAIGVEVGVTRKDSAIKAAVAQVVGGN